MRVVRSGGIRVKGKVAKPEIYKNSGVVKSKDIKKDLPWNKRKTWIKILEEK